eukprot:scaffold1236_cov138-Skeletonema_marinoi.AAC.19
MTVMFVIARTGVIASSMEEWKITVWRQFLAITDDITAYERYNATSITAIYTTLLPLSELHGIGLM